MIPTLRKLNELTIHLKGTLGQKTNEWQQGILSTDSDNKTIFNSFPSFPCQGGECQIL